MRAVTDYFKLIEHNVYDSPSCSIMHDAQVMSPYSHTDERKDQDQQGKKHCKSNTVTFKFSN